MLQSSYQAVRSILISQIYIERIERVLRCLFRLTPLTTNVRLHTTEQGILYAAAFQTEEKPLKDLLPRNMALRFSKPG